MNGKKYRILIRDVGLQTPLLVFAIILSFLSVACEGLSVTLLVPVTQSLFNGNFSFLSEAGYFGRHISSYMADLDSFNFKVFLLLVGFAVLFHALNLIIEYFSSVLYTHWQALFSHRLRAALLKKMLRFGKQFFDSNSQGSLHTLVMVHTTRLGFLLRVIRSIIFWVAMVFVYLCVMIYLSWKLTLIFCILGPFLYSLQRWIVIKIRATSKDVARVELGLGRYFYNVISCIPLVQSSCGENLSARKFEERSLNLALFEASIFKKTTLMQPAQRLLFVFPIFGLLVFMGHLLNQGSATDLGALFVFAYVAKRVFTGINLLGGFRGELGAIHGVIDDIVQILSGSEHYQIENGQKPFSGIKKGIKFRNLSFSYPGKKAVLDDLNLTLNSKETTALVGATGAGKTSVASLILRFYDCPPKSIFVDDVDIREFDIKSFRRAIAYVTQDVHLFNDTIRENLIFGFTKEVSELKLQDALKRARLWDFVSSLPNGLDSEIGDRGVVLSGGERQRLAIARAFLSEAEIIILDEATSALDSITEAQVQEAMEDLIAGKTAIVIAHRLSTIKNADKVVLLENGKNIEEGTFNELVELKGSFFNYWEQQKLEKN